MTRSRLVIPTSELEIAPEELQTSDPQLLILNFKFLHDRVQQAAYALIDDEQKKAVHLKIGRLLLEKISPQERDTRIFEVADHLNVGRELVADHQELTELYHFHKILLQLIGIIFVSQYPYIRKKNVRSCSD